MSKLQKGNIYIEVCHNQCGGLSLCVGDDNSGTRISGGKVGGCETLKRFEVNAEELISEIKSHVRPNAEIMEQRNQLTEIRDSSVIKLPSPRFGHWISSDDIIDAIKKSGNRVFVGGEEC